METTSELTFLSALLPFAGIVFIIAVGVVLLNQQFQKNLYKQQLQQEALKNQHQQELLRSSIQVQEDERKRIAQDLHDELGAMLSITRMHLVQLERQNKNNTKVLPALQQVRSLTESSLASMRRISHELMPPLLENFGLMKTLETVADRLTKTNEIDIQITDSLTIPELSWPIQLGMYRILMELINNTIKHAQSKSIFIDFVFEHQAIVCRYKDDGKGLPEGELLYGLGYKSMEGRVNSLGGKLTIGNNSMKGFSAEIIIPL